MKKAKSGRGGRRVGSGRRPGIKNKATMALKEMAGEYTGEAIKTLVDVMRDPESPPTVKVQAADKLLDRSHGRPAIHIEPTGIDITVIPWDELRAVTVKALERAEQKHREIIEGRYERLGIKREYSSD